MQERPIAVIGSFTTIGQAVLDCLADRGFSIDRVDALDAHQNAGRRIPFCDGELVVRPLDLFDFTRPYIAFLCTSSILSEYKEEAVRQGCWLIDCTGLIGTAPQIIPALNAKDIRFARDNIIGNPTSLTVSLAQVLAPIHKQFQIIRADAVALLGAGEFGHEATISLLNQTRSLYTRVETPLGPFQKIQAFNLIPEANPILSRRTMEQLEQVLGCRVFVTTCLTPIFQGECYFVTIQTKRPCSMDKLIRLLRRQKNCRFVDTLDYITITPHDVISEDMIYVTHLNGDTVQSNTFHFWIVCDSIRTGAALNAVKIAEYLLT